MTSSFELKETMDLNRIIDLTVSDIRVILEVIKNYFENLLKYEFIQ
ncbi:MAG: hypothetical protein GX121_02690 [Ignavibacteria bacterium]|nr:hypothetical protein [Ignavibacteria bacterium]